MLRRLAAILLLLAFTGLGSGALARLHDLQYEHESGQPAQGHDEQTCIIHALLRMPVMPAVAAGVLMLLGALLVRRPLPLPVPIDHRPACRLDCRGPPALN